MYTHVHPHPSGLDLVPATCFAIGLKSKLSRALCKPNRAADALFGTNCHGNEVWGRARCPKLLPEPALADQHEGDQWARWGLSYNPGSHVGTCSCLQSAQASSSQLLGPGAFQLLFNYNPKDGLYYVKVTFRVCGLRGFTLAGLHNTLFHSVESSSRAGDFINTAMFSLATIGR